MAKRKRRFLLRQWNEVFRTDKNTAGKPKKGEKFSKIRKGKTLILRFMV